MATEVTQSESFYKAWAWFETNKKQVAWGASILVVVGLVTWFFIYQQGQKRLAASEALSVVSTPQLGMSGARPDAGEAFLKVAANYPKSSAASRALLFAAGSFFVEGKYDQSKTQFERFLREHRGSALTGQALLGIAACLDAQGKTNEAITAYKDLVDHYPRENSTPQAKFSLARLYNAQGKPEQAFALYEDLARTEPYASIGSESGMRAEELKLKFPHLGVNTNLPPANLPPGIMPTAPQIKLEDALTNVAPGTGTTAAPVPSTSATSGTPVPLTSTTTNIVPLFAPSNPVPSTGATSAPPKQ